MRSQDRVDRWVNQHFVWSMFLLGVLAAVLLFSVWFLTIKDKVHTDWPSICGRAAEAKELIPGTLTGGGLFSQPSCIATNSEGRIVRISDWRDYK